MPPPQLLGICGALRTGSTNRMLLGEAFRLFGQAEVTLADLRLPLYDGDLEDQGGIPASVGRLASQIAESDAVVISTPEYNKAPPGVLKNALDWVSRVDGNPWQDKPVAILSAAAGRAGGEASQFALRLQLNPFRPRVLAGPAVMLASSRSAFDADNRLKEERMVKTLRDLMAGLRAEIRAA
jgi:chromate reductase